MATFQSWLMNQVDRTDPVGELARSWSDDKKIGKTPKVSSPGGIASYFELRSQGTTDWADTWRPRMEATVDAYHASRSDQAAQPPGSMDMLRRMQVQLDRIETDTSRIAAVLGLDPLDDSQDGQVTVQLLAADWPTLAAVADYTEEPGEVA